MRGLIATIAHRHGLSEETIQYTIHAETIRVEEETPELKRRPPTLSEIDVRRFIRGIRRYPSLSYDTIRYITSTSTCNKTIRKTLRASGCKTRGYRWIADQPAEKQLVLRNTQIAR